MGTPENKDLLMQHELVVMEGILESKGNTGRSSRQA